MILELSGIWKVFRLGTEAVEALCGVDLALEEGEFVTVIGSNGAGKSTLLNVIAGTCRPNRGRVRIGGKDVTKWPAHRRARWIGRVFQDPLRGTAAHMTLAENLALALKKGRRGFSLLLTPARKRYLRKLLEPLGMELERRLGERVGHLSGGERQAVTVLMATLARPKLLLLDEHTAALDPANAEKVLEITERLVGEARITTLMVTHRMDQALSLGNRLIMMHKGKIRLDLSAEEKERLSVTDLVDLFRRLGVTDDALLLAGNGAASADGS